MSGSCGNAREIERKTVSPPTPESKTPMGPDRIEDFFSILNPRSSILNPLGIVRCGHPRASLAADVVLLDLLVQVRAGRIDRVGGLRDVPAELAQLRDD